MGAAAAGAGATVVYMFGERVAFVSVLTYLMGVLIALSRRIMHGDRMQIDGTIRTHIPNVVLGLLVLTHLHEIVTVVWLLLATSSVEIAANEGAYDVYIERMLTEMVHLRDFFSPLIHDVVDGAAAAVASITEAPVPMPGAPADDVPISPVAPHPASRPRRHRASVSPRPARSRRER